MSHFVYMEDYSENQVFKNLEYYFFFGLFSKKNDSINFDVNLKDENKQNQPIKDNLVQFKGEIFDKQFICQNNFNIWKRTIKDLSEIDYFGGFDSFIPLFKIIKYSINYFFKIDITKNEKEDFLNTSIQWMNPLYLLTLLEYNNGFSNRGN